jgi:hypothetical protein
MRVASLLGLAVLLATTPAALAAPAPSQPTVHSFSLPARRDSDALRRLAADTAAELARHLPAAVTVADPPAGADELTGRLERANSLFVAGSLDEAAAALDAALEQGARSPDRVGAPTKFLSGHFARASIAFARGEKARGHALLERVLRFDPSAELAVSEQTPILQAELEEARRRIGAAAGLRPGDLGEACRRADIVIVARRIADGGAEVLRFDQCRVVARVQIRWRIDRPPLLLSDGERQQLELGVAGQFKRKHRWVPVVILGSGAAVAAGGGVMAWFASREFDRLAASPCGLAGTCDQSEYQNGKRRQRAGWILVAAGGAAALVGGGWAVWSWRSGKQERRLRAWLVPMPTGLHAVASF